MYKNEAAFAAAFVKEARRRYGLVQRIESGGTGRGVPDVFCAGDGGGTWFELKNLPSASIHNSCWKPGWRGGQQAWAREYYLATKGHEYVFTVAALSDGFLLVPHTKVYGGGKVEAEEGWIRPCIADVITLAEYLLNRMKEKKNDKNREN